MHHHSGAGGGDEDGYNIAHVSADERAHCEEAVDSEFGAYSAEDRARLVNAFLRERDKARSQMESEIDRVRGMRDQERSSSANLFYEMTADVKSDPIRTLASQLPLGVAERVLQEAVEQHHAKPRWFTCPTCNGSGEALVLGEMGECQLCGGAGDITRYVFEGVPNG